MVHLNERLAWTIVTMDSYRFSRELSRRRRGVVVCGRPFRDSQVARWENDSTDRKTHRFECSFSEQSGCFLGDGTINTKVAGRGSNCRLAVKFRLQRRNSRKSVSPSRVAARGNPQNFRAQCGERLLANNRGGPTVQVTSQGPLLF